jgi:hypothetical protein
LPRKSGIYQISANALQNALCVQNFHDSTFPEPICSLGGIDRALGGVQ